VLKTPESYNTVLGIAKVIDLELDDLINSSFARWRRNKRGEIKELVKMLKPRYGILTGINEQHLEMFGSIEKYYSGKV